MHVTVSFLNGIPTSTLWHTVISYHLRAASFQSGIVSELEVPVTHAEVIGAGQLGDSSIILSLSMWPGRTQFLWGTPANAHSWGRPQLHSCIPAMT